RTNTYLFNLYSNRNVVNALGAFEIGLGNDLAFLSTRASYKLNLKGPSYAIHTACSTSLVAVHLACQSLLIDECQIALAGGVAVNIPQKTGYRYQPGGILSPDGYCRAFDAQARGTIFGSGVGIVVLKRLADALSDRDFIHAVIKGSATNNDGALKASFTAPSVYGQTEVILEALASAGVSPETISYIEAHGTGTALGDPIEIRALTKAFSTASDKKRFCAVGSVKSNFGHLDAAAGIASLIKVVLALKHRQLPPTLYFNEPNPHIDFDQSPFYVNNRLSEWQADSLPRRAGVSSFGVGGTNAHIIVEEAPTINKPVDSRAWQLLLLSAKTASALETTTANLIAHLKDHQELNLADVAYTLQVGRGTFDHRRMLVCKHLEDAFTTLETLDPNRVFTDSQECYERPVVFMFPGQGTQYVNMARELYQSEPTFRQQVDICSEILIAHIGLDLRHLLYPQDNDIAEAQSKLNQTAFTQPALFVIEYALAKLWMQWGVHPQAMIGHSIGEYVAACLAGVFSLTDALYLVALRGKLMQSLMPGAMLSVPLSENAARDLLNKNLSLAAVNGPSLSVIAGSLPAIDELENQLKKQGIVSKRLTVTHAFHSQMMDAIVDTFAENVKKIALQSPQIPYISNVTGSWINTEEATNADYWAHHLRQTV
ncbi:MAG: type I polyketide synthase, partial [Acidobacteriota bacterium]